MGRAKLTVTTAKSHGLRRAAKALGSYGAIARGLKLTPSAISRWKAIPEQYLKRIERLSGVDRKLLRPDLYN